MSAARDFERCYYCHASVVNDSPGEWVDDLGSAYCEQHIEGCGACDDGEPHPHAPGAIS